MKTKDIPGVVTVEPGVLETIARLSALEVPGVVRIAKKDVDRIWGTGKPVNVLVEDDEVAVTLHIIGGPAISLLRLGQAVQYGVTRAIQQMIGMRVKSVNVHIEDVVYPEPENALECVT